MTILRLFLFGPPRIEFDGAPVEFPRRKALALLIYLAGSGQAHSRDALATLFWPDHTQRRARAYVRRDLAIINTSPVGEWLFTSGDTVELKRNTDPSTPVAGQVLWVDVDHFRRLLATCQSHDHPPDLVCSDCLALLTEAVTLYTDDFLSGFTLRDSREFDEWQFFLGESLRQELASALERLVQGLSAHEETEAAIPHARRWVALDLLHEPAQRQLMQLYAQSGQQAAALRQYEEYGKHLKSELDLSPEEETTTLYETIKAKRFPRPLSQETETLDRSETPFLTSSVSMPPTPPAPLLTDSSTLDETEGPVFVARQQELAQLDAFLGTALTGQNWVAFVTGEAGQGKTALLQAFTRRAQEVHPNLIVAGGNCNAHTGQGDPYLPFREILELLTGDVEARAVAGTLSLHHAHRLQQMLPITTQALVEQGPDLLNRFVSARSLLSRTVAASPGAAWLEELQKLTISNPETGNTGVQQTALFEHYAKVIQQVARHAPLLLFLDDVQWIDTGSAGLLLHLGKRLVGYPVLIVAAYRPAEIALGRNDERHPLERVINEFQRDFGDIILDLGQTEGEVFINALLDFEANALDHNFRQTLYRQTRGHPLFTLELLRGMQERGDLVRDEAGRWIEQPKLDWERLPARVEGAIGERIDRLESSLRELLQVASVEGEEFTAELVARVLDVDERKVVRQLGRELDKKHRLVRVLGLKRAGTLRLSRYRFRHILIQRYLYNSLDKVERAYLNEAMGDTLESLYSEQTDSVAGQLGRYYQEAGVPEKAVGYLLQAGTRASHLSAHEEAIGHFTQALTLLDTLPDTPERARRELELQIALGPALIAARGYAVPEVKQAYSRARALIQHGEESPQLFRVLFGLWGFYLVRAELRTTRELGEQALALAQRLQDPTLLLEAHRALGMTLFHRGEFALARTHLEQGSAIYDPQQHGSLAVLSVADPGVTCLAYLARTLWHLGFPEQAVSKSYEALKLAQELSHPFSLAAAQVYTARVHQCRREAQATQEQAEAAIALSTEQGFPHYIAMGTVLQGWAIAQLGNGEEGMAQIGHGLTAGRSTRIEVARTHFLGMLAEVYGRVGQFEQGLRVLNEALATIDKSEEHQWEAELYRLKGELLLNDEASQGWSPEDCFLKAIKIAHRQGSKSLELRAVMSLSRLWQAQEKKDEARQMLAKIYDWFNEGHDTVDLKEARALLEELT